MGEQGGLFGDIQVKKTHVGKAAKQVLKDFGIDITSFSVELKPSSKRFVVMGNVPSKSNCYRIITFRSKEAKSKFVPCEADGCDKGFVDEHFALTNTMMKVPCKDCKGTGMIEIPPAPRASLAKSSELKKYEKDFLRQWTKTPMVEEEFEIDVDVYYPSRRSDLDNSLKVLLDCLQAVGAIKNDNLCMRIVTEKFLDKENPRIEFTIRPRK